MERQLGRLVICEVAAQGTSPRTSSASATPCTRSSSARGRRVPRDGLPTAGQPRWPAHAHPSARARPRAPCRRRRLPRLSGRCAAWLRSTIGSG